MEEAEERYEDLGDQGISKEKEEARKRQLAALAPYQYKKGQSGNPSGRPPGISMKEYLKRKFNTMTNEEREEYLEGISKLDLMKMAEGNPKQDTEMGGNIKIINVTVPKPVAETFNIHGTDQEAGGGNTEQVQVQGS